ncbi:MAG: hypothetical protein K0R63_1165 [Rickettsiales bacterium]|nr:hypothetical protein [Rickettsiales bacterium]
MSGILVFFLFKLHLGGVIQPSTRKEFWKTEDSTAILNEIQSRQKAIIEAAQGQVTYYTPITETKKTIKTLKQSDTPDVYNARMLYRASLEEDAPLPVEVVWRIGIYLANEETHPAVADVMVNFGAKKVDSAPKVMQLVKTWKARIEAERQPGSQQQGQGRS